MTMTNPYTVLGVSPTATPTEITHAYRRQLRDQHPDTRGAPSDAAADDRLREIVAAYALLRDPQRRAAFDRAHPVSGGSAPVRIPVAHNESNDEAPLRAGPVRWHRKPS